MNTPTPSAHSGEGKPSVEELAQFIRLIDGNNMMGAATMAERILNWMGARELERSEALERKHEQSEPVAECGVCGGLGWIDETIGGYAFANPKAPCPECDGTGCIAPPPSEQAGISDEHDELLTVVADMRAHCDRENPESCDEVSASYCLSWANRISAALQSAFPRGVGSEITPAILAQAMKVKAADVIRALFKEGVFVTLNQSLDLNTVVDTVRLFAHPAPEAQAEPVAWQCRYLCPDEGWGMWQHALPEQLDLYRRNGNYELRPLYLHPQPSFSEKPSASETPSAEIAFLEAWLNRAAEPIGQQCCGRGFLECCGSPDPVFMEPQLVIDEMAKRHQELTAAIDAQRKGGGGGES